MLKSWPPNFEQSFKVVLPSLSSNWQKIFEGMSSSPFNRHLFFLSSGTWREDWRHKCTSHVATDRISCEVQTKWNSSLITSEGFLQVLEFGGSQLVKNVLLKKKTSRVQCTRHESACHSERFSQSVWNCFHCSLVGNEQKFSSFLVVSSKGHTLLWSFDEEESLRPFNHAHEIRLMVKLLDSVGRAWARAATCRMEISSELRLCRSLQSFLKLPNIADVGNQPFDLNSILSLIRKSWRDTLTTNSLWRFSELLFDTYFIFWRFFLSNKNRTKFELLTCWTAWLWQHKGSTVEATGCNSAIAELVFHSKTKRSSIVRNWALRKQEAKFSARCLRKTSFSATEVAQAIGALPNHPLETYLHVNKPYNYFPDGNTHQTSNNTESTFSTMSSHRGLRSTDKVSWLGSVHLKHECLAEANQLCG